MYAAVRDTDPVTGLGDLLAGNQPKSRTPGGARATGDSDTVEFPGTMGAGFVPHPIPISQTVVVGGIRVSKTIAPNIQRLLADARADGFTKVSGGGWRSIEQQRALRLLHGYTSDSQASGSGGRLPVAIPGTSRHEMGEAIDWTYNGHRLSKEDAFFTWLSDHAGSYGLRNLPSEPWHWSTDGH